MKEDRQRMATVRGTKSKTYDMVYIGVFVVLIAICSWISIPIVVPVTLQTFAIFLAVAVLGGKLGTMAVVVYMLLGAIGIPVFSGFMGGIGRLLGNTGGYMIGFIFSSLFMWAVERGFGRKTWVLAVSMVLGLGICYLFGTVWFMIVYAGNSGTIGLTTVLGYCVFPFIIPDLVKLALVLFLRRRIAEVVRIY